MTAEAERPAGRDVPEGDGDGDRFAGRDVAEGERDSDRLAGETDISQAGYPEEAPPGAAPGGDDRPSEDSPPREGAKAPRKHDDQAGESEPGKATGNPRSAG